MRADETSWPYNNPGGDEPDWAAGDGHPAARQRQRPGLDHGDDSWPANGNGQDWTAGDDSWPVNGNGNGQDWPYGEDHPSYPANGNGQDWTAGDDKWPVNGNGPAWPYGEDHPSWPPAATPRTGRAPVADPSRHGGSRRPHCTTTPACRRHRRRQRAPVARVRVPANGGPDGAQQRPGPRGGQARRRRRITRSPSVRAGSRFLSPPPTRTSRRMSGQAPGRCPRSRRKTPPSCSTPSGGIPVASGMLTPSGWRSGSSRTPTARRPT